MVKSSCGMKTLTQLLGSASSEWVNHASNLALDFEPDPRENIPSLSETVETVASVNERLGWHTGSYLGSTLFAHHLVSATIRH
jgi:hypothetical protein